MKPTPHMPGTGPRAKPHAHEDRKPDSPRWPVFLMLVGTTALWGGTWPVGRVVSATVDPWNAALLRFTMASIALVLICIRIGGFRALKLRPALLPLLLSLGATGIFGYSFLFFSGLRTTDAGRAGLIVGCIPASIALFSSVIARQRPSRLAMAGILMSLMGVWIVISHGHPLTMLGGEIRSGDLMILGCVFCWTAYTLLARLAMRELAPLVAVTWSCLLGTLLILPFALAGGLLREIGSTSATAWAGLVYLGVPATSLAYYWYYHAIRRIGGMATGMFINLVPLFALASGSVFLGETVQKSEVWGGLLVIAGVVIAMRARQPSGRPVP